MLTPVRLQDGQILSVDSDFETRPTREGDYVYTIKSNNSALGSSRPRDIVNGPEVSVEGDDAWLQLYLLSKLAWRLDMLGLTVEYNLTGTCRVISVFYHFLPVYMTLAQDQKLIAFGGDGFCIAAKVNGSDVLMKSEGERGEGLQLVNRVHSMGFSAVLAMWRSWLSRSTTRTPGRIGTGKLHTELIALGDMGAFNISAKYSDTEACLSLLLSVVYPQIEYYKQRVRLYTDVLVCAKLKESISTVYDVDVAAQLGEIGGLPVGDDLEDTEYDHFAGVTQSLARFTGSIAGETCFPKKEWSPQSLCSPRRVFVVNGVTHRVTVSKGKLQSDRGFTLLCNAMKCITGLTILGNGVTLQHEGRLYNDSNRAIVNGLLSGYFGAKPGLWMLNLLSEGLVKVDITNSNSIAQCATNVGTDGVIIDVGLPPKIADKLAYVTEDGTKRLTMVSAYEKAVEVITSPSGTYSWKAVDNVDVSQMEQFTMVHRRATK